MQTTCSAPKIDPMLEQLTDAITAELAQTIRKLGGDPGGMNLADPWQGNRVLEFLGADAIYWRPLGPGTTH
jgi:hypothetical protein